MYKNFLTGVILYANKLWCHLLVFMVQRLDWIVMQMWFNLKPTAPMYDWDVTIQIAQPPWVAMQFYVKLETSRKKMHNNMHEEGRGAHNITVTSFSAARASYVIWVRGFCFDHFLLTLQFEIFANLNHAHTTYFDSKDSVR